MRQPPRALPLIPPIRVRLIQVDVYVLGDGGAGGTGPWALDSSLMLIRGRLRTQHLMQSLLFEHASAMHWGRPDTALAQVGTVPTRSLASSTSSINTIFFSVSSTFPR
jgi:hypothetical protein